jgi:nuclear pore complex protein Nup155
LCFLDAGPEDDYQEMHLLPEPLFTLQTDNVYMSGITGTLNGRIFLCGRDGCVYEMDYQVFRHEICMLYSMCMPCS